MEPTAITVLGAGAWGTAIAVHLAKMQGSVSLCCKSEEQAKELASSGVNTKYLPDVKLVDNLVVTSNLVKAIDKSKKVEKAVTSNIKELEKDKQKNKKEISNLKRKLTISQKNTKGMEKAFGENDADKAAEYLKKFMD